MVARTSSSIERSYLGRAQTASTLQRADSVSSWKSTLTSYDHHPNQSPTSLNAPHKKLNIRRHRRRHRHCRHCYCHHCCHRRRRRLRRRRHPGRCLCCCRRHRRRRCRRRRSLSVLASVAAATAVVVVVVAAAALHEGFGTSCASRAQIES